MAEIKFTKYERGRLIGARALQLSMGAPLLLKLNEEELKSIRYDPIKMAMAEFEKGILPISIKRSMPEKLQ
ncbi:DNA-directed RNA polymerase subunit K [Candidatus Woesearchaeota archaeon]|nr:DNA-directed RNA polymerase subunit K [Candidatus Woesearchaeota archaeon]